MTALQVMVLISGQNKAIALSKCIEEGVSSTLRLGFTVAQVSHMWTVSAFQMHRTAIIVCDEDATMELRVKTVWC